MPTVEVAPKTLGEALLRAAGRDAGIRFVDRHERTQRVSWTELWDRANDACGRLQAVGVRPEDRVAVVLTTTAESLAALYGIMLAGAVPVPIAPPMRPAGLSEYICRTAAMIARVGARLLLVEPALRQSLERMAAAAGVEMSCQSLAEMDPGRSSPADSVPERLALIQFSSGTTADPKPVELTHRAVMAQVGLLNRLWPDTEEVHHTGVSWLPLYHDMGLIGGLLPAIERGRELTLIPPEVFLARPAIWLRAICRQGATVSGAPSSGYAFCVQRIEDRDLEGVDLSCWRVALNGAEAVAPGVLREFNSRFAPWGLRPEAMTPAYGLSETCLAVTVSEITRPFVSRRFDRERLAEGRAVASAEGLEIVCNGTTLPGFEISIRSQDGAEQPAGGVGGIWVRGPTLMRGYFGDAKATRAVLREGWLDTGDQGFLDGGGLYLTGRRKDILIVRGRNYSPDLVEHAVREVPGVAGAGVAAATFLPEGGERELLHLLVEVARDVAADDRRQMAERCRRSVLAATGLLVDRFVPLRSAALPRTSSGKIRRQEALRRLRKGKMPLAV